MISDAGVDVVTSTVIHRPREQVSAYVADPSNAPRWYVNIESVEWHGEPHELQVGARMDFVAHFLGRRLAYTYEVTDYVAGERLVMRALGGLFPMETTYRWEDVEGGTRMTLRNRGEPRGFGRVAAPIMAGAVRRANRKDLARLKGLMEAGGGAAGETDPSGE